MKFGIISILLREEMAADRWATMERLASIDYTGIEGAPTDGSLDDVRRTRERLDALGLEVVANRSQA
jgi:hypothetical protein